MLAHVYTCHALQCSLLNLQRPGLVTTFAVLGCTCQHLILLHLLMLARHPMQAMQDTRCMHIPWLGFNHQELTMLCPQFGEKPLGAGAAEEAAGEAANPDSMAVVSLISCWALTCTFLLDSASQSAPQAHSSRQQPRQARLVVWRNAPKLLLRARLLSSACTTATMDALMQVLCSLLQEPRQARKRKAAPAASAVPAPPLTKGEDIDRQLAALDPQALGYAFQKDRLLRIKGHWETMQLLVQESEIGKVTYANSLERPI